MAQSDNDSVASNDDILRKLMKKYGVVYEGRIIPEKWGEYATLFNEVRNIGSIDPQEVINSSPLDDRYTTDLQVRQSELIRGAWDCLDKRGTEADWRLAVENTAFKSLNAEVICHACLKRLWKPMFPAMPVDPAVAEKLQHRRTKRELCSCTPLERAKITDNDHDPRALIDSSDKYINHEDLSAPAKQQVASTRRLRQRPDRVMGLRATRTLLEILPHLKKRCCPFKDGNIIYPFLVIEVKSAETTANPGQVLRQKAFPIRTCMRLQQNLQAETGLPHQCLVWSFGVIGEEWRLYASIPRGRNIEIFDLWHGSLLHPEGAFRLLLLMDYICDWAYDVYRESVVASLLLWGGHILNSRLSPSGTEITSQRSDAGIEGFREWSASASSSMVPVRHVTGLADDNESFQHASCAVLEQLYVDGVQLGTDPDLHPWNRWLNCNSGSPTWASRGIIRHINQMRLVYLFITLPGDPQSVQTLLERLFPELPSSAAAKSLLSVFKDEGMTIPIAMIDTAHHEHTRVQTRRPARAFAYLRCSLQRDDWQVLRMVYCVSCDQDGMEVLARIAGQRSCSSSQWNSAFVVDSSRLVSVMISTLKAVNPSTVGLTLTRSKLFLKVTADEYGGLDQFEWVKFKHRENGGLVAFEMERLLAHVAQHDQQLPESIAPYVKQLCVSAVVDGTVPTGIHFPPVNELYEPHTRGVLIRKPSNGWPVTTQDFCLLVLSHHIDFYDEETLGNLLEQTRHDQLFGIARDVVLDAADEAFLDKWANTLKGEVGEESPID